MRTSFYTALLIITLFALAGCDTRPQPTAQVSPLTSPLIPATLEPAWDIPTPKPNSGVIKGTLKIENTNLPVNGIDVFLGEHVGSTSDTPLFGLDPKSAPHAVTDPAGRFVFTDVKPGKYSLIVWNPINSFMVRTPDKKSALEFTVEAQKTVDLGVLTEPLPQ